MRFDEGRVQYAMRPGPDKSPLSDVPYVPPPHVRTARERARIPFSTWQWLYRDDIDGFFANLDSIVDEHTDASLEPAMHAARDDAEYWLYLNSTSALRGAQYTHVD